ncbi:MAG TPA: phage tail tape measure protein, partial [Chroococcidiopsis sp.]
MSQSALEILITASNSDAIDAIVEVQQQIERIQKTSRNFQDLGRSLTGIGQSMTQNLTLPIVAGLGAAGYAAVQFESQMADLNKAYGFDNGSQQAADAQAVIMDLSREMRQMPGDVTAIATEAGKLGVQFGQLEDYTRTVTAASVAFDVSAQEAGSSMATLTNVLGYQDAQGRVNIEGLQSLGDAINYFADTGATSEAAIMNVLQRAGGATRTFGLANNSATALSAAFLNLGYAPEVVGTSLNSMLPSLQNATQQSGDFQDALAQIGLPAREFEQMIKHDAVGAITTFMDAVAESGDTSLIQRMFGSGSDSAMMTSAIQNLDAFKNTLLDTENIPAGSMMATFTKRQQTTQSALEGVQASLMRMAISIGSVLLPALNDIAAAIVPVIDGFTSFADANPAIAQIGVALALVAAAVGPVLIAVGSVVSAIGTIGGAIAMMGGAAGIMGAVSGAVGLVAGSFVAIAGVAAGLLAIPAAILAIGAAVTGTDLQLQDIQATIGLALQELPANLAQVGPAIGAFLGLISAQFTMIGTTIQLAFTQASVAVQTFVTGLVTGVGTAIAGVVIRITTGAGQAVTAIAEAGPKMVSAVTS